VSGALGVLYLVRYRTPPGGSDSGWDCDYHRVDFLGDPGSELEALRLAGASIVKNGFVTKDRTYIPGHEVISVTKYAPPVEVA
jgi:hypothetical protein